MNLKTILAGLVIFVIILVNHAVRLQLTVYLVIQIHILIQIRACPIVLSLINIKIILTGLASFVITTV